MVGEAGAKLEGAFESEAAMPKVSRTEAALSPKGRGADSEGESEAAITRIKGHTDFTDKHR